MTAPVLSAIDSVYMLMFEGWTRELRSNRWHFARRWSRHHPVVLVQPDQPGGRWAVAVPEQRIPRTTILSVRRPSTGSFYEVDVARVVAQLARYMLEAGHRRPLLWL